MKPRSIPFFFLLLFLAAPVAFASDKPQFDPPALYLTWQRDPATTMTIHWHTVWTGGYRDPALEYQAKGDTAWKSAVGSWRPMPFTERLIHTVELSGLKPDTDYAFRLGKLKSSGVNESTFEADSPVYHFRTMPATADSPLLFAVGGDVYSDRGKYETMSRLVARQEPRFVLIGGDIAYANGQPRNAGRWEVFLEVWKKEMVTPGGRMIPILPAIGNHETHGDDYSVSGGSVGRGISPNRAPYFFSLFSMPGLPGYNALDFGSYMSVFLLDSFHANPVAGLQTDWLRDALAKRRQVAHIFPIYHVPAYPSHRPFDGAVSKMIREHWSPLFEQNGVRLVFENHDHTYKRTHPMRAGQPHEDGVVYIGDGAWAVGVRTVHPILKAPYLAKAESVNHVHLVTIHRGERHVRSMDIDGRVFDEFRMDGKGRVEVLGQSPVPPLAPAK